MSQVILDLPPAPDGGQWCFVCFAFYKRAVIQVEEIAQRIGAAETDGHDGRVMIRPRKLPELPLLPAVTSGLTTFLPGVVVPVCWAHGAAIAETERQLVQGVRGLPDGLLRGKG